MQRARYKPPQPPDMLSNGMPQVHTLRTSRVRQVRCDDDLTTEPVYPDAQRGLVQRIIRGILAHWFPLACGVFLLLGLYTGYRQWVAPTWHSLQAQWHTGDGRITQLDANVGHGGVSHFLAQYYHGYLVVIEMPPQDPTHIQAYTVLALEPSAEKSQDVTLTVQDVNHDGRLDLVIQKGNNSMAIVLYNTGSGFSASQGKP